MLRRWGSSQGRSLRCAPDRWSRYAPDREERNIRCQAALVDIPRFGGVDPLKLALAAQIGLEVSEHTDISRKALPITVPAVQSPCRHPLGLERVHDAPYVPHQTGQTINRGKRACRRREIADGSGEL